MGSAGVTSFRFCARIGTMDHPSPVTDVMQFTVNMPDRVARRWGETPEEVGRHVMEDAAIEGYRAGRLSHRQVGEMLGLDYWQTEAFLKECRARQSCGEGP